MIEENTSASEEAKDQIKGAFDPNNPDQGKTVAIIAHLTLIGWVIALVMNNGNKSEIGSFYIRQSLGIMLISIVGSFIPFVNILVWIFVFVLWIMSIIGAFSGEKKPVFLLGSYFQEWFKSL